jgi:hypothetical protein
MLSLTAVYAGPYAPAAGQDGSAAVPLDSAVIASWATTAEYAPGEDVSEEFQDESQALGPANGNPLAVVSLGRGGTLTLSFGKVFRNQPGPEFAVFENGFSDNFLELAFVEVSSDGEHFVRFPNFSETPEPVDSFGALDATNVTGLAGKYRGGFGTPFDFADLPADPNLDLNAVNFVRLVDVVGGEDSELTELSISRDSMNRPIYDPFPTEIGAGFDCDGVALLKPQVVEIFSTEVVADEFVLSWRAEVGASYRLEASASLLAGSWEEVAVVAADTEIAEFRRPLIEGGREFLRIVELP